MNKTNHTKFKEIGETIKEKYKELGIKSVGRRYGGLHSINFQEDVSTGRWRSFEYEVSNVDPVNRNWMSVEESLNAVN